MKKTRSTYYYCDEPPRGYSLWERNGGKERCVFSTEDRIEYDGEWYDPKEEGFDPFPHIVHIVSYSAFCRRISKKEFYEKLFLENI